MNRQRGYITLLLYAGAALAVMAVLWGAYKWVDTSWETTAGIERGTKTKQAEWDEAKRVQREQEAKKIAEATTKQEVQREKIKTVYRTITKNVDRYIDRPVYRAACFDELGMRDINAALRGPDAPAGKPDSGLPRPDAAGRSDGGERAP